MRAWPLIENTLLRNETCVMVSVVESLGSAPRDAGARLVVLPGGEFHGTIGGGQLEWRALAMARELRDDKTPALSFHEFALGPELGQCCGGAVKLMFEIFEPARCDEVKSLAAAQQRSALQTRGTIGARGIERAVAEEKPRFVHALQITGQHIEEIFGKFHRPLYLFGAGHIGHALVRVLAAMPFDVIWLDQRADMLPQKDAENIRAVHSTDPLGVLEDAAKDSFVLILTHSHDLDFALGLKALAANTFGFVGMIGSKSKKQRFIKRFKQAGLNEVQINPFICPIGIDGISSKTPDAIAISVMAQLLIEDEKRQ